MRAPGPPWSTSNGSFPPGAKRRQCRSLPQKLIELLSDFAFHGYFDGLPYRAIIIYDRQK
jgi:hypothetical protein